MSALTPCPNDGEGRHLWIFHAAQTLRRNGYPAEVAIEAIAAQMRRTGPEKRDEVARTVAKVYGQPMGRLGRAGLAPARVPTCFEAFNKVGTPQDFLRLIESSPPRTDWPTTPAEFVRAVLPDAPFICCGESPRHARTIAAWAASDAVLQSATVVVPNPLSVDCGLNKQGKPSTRCESMVHQRKYFIAEFDGLSLPDQAVRILHLRDVCRMPLVAIVFSGRKSLHTWWVTEHLSSNAAGQFMTHAVQATGADSAFLSPVQMTRLPFVRRPETGNMQNLIYFNKNLLLKELV